MCVLRRWAVPAEPPDPRGVARFCPVIDGHVVVATVVVPLDIKLLEQQLNDLMREGPRDEVYRFSGENHRAFKSTVSDSDERLLSLLAYWPINPHPLHPHAHTPF